MPNHLKNNFFYFLIYLCSFEIQAQVTFRWLGISNFVLNDGKTAIMFDPSITRASIWDYVFFRKISSDEQEINYWLDRCKIQKLDAIFVNHSHFDHASDASFMAKKFQSPIYGSSSTVNLGLGQGVSKNLLSQIKPTQTIQVGDFKITVYLTPHPPHFSNILLMDGNIENPLAEGASVWDYKVGETFSFYISHPKANILFQSNGRILNPDPLADLRPDVLLLTIANRPSTEDLINKRIIPSHPKSIFPLHHDNFFYPLKREGQIDFLWGIKIDEFKEKTKNFKVTFPRYCQEYKLNY